MLRHGRSPQAIRRILIFGDGCGANTPQTGAERQAVSLGSAILLASKLRDPSELASSGWRVRTQSLSAVDAPMPRLFRPLPAFRAIRVLTVTAGHLYLRDLGFFRKLIPENLIVGDPLPPPYDKARNDYTDTVIIAAGSAPSGASVLRRQLQLNGAKLVQLLHPRVSLDAFDAVVTPRHDFAPGDRIPENVITTNGSLHDITVSGLAQHMLNNPSEDIMALSRPRISVLLGGPRQRIWGSPSHGWRDADALQLSRAVSGLAGQRGGVMLTVSRRTPALFVRRVQRELHLSLGLNRVLFDDGSVRSRYLLMLGSSDAIVVTADSVNMISEAMASCSPVFISGYSAVTSPRLDRFIRDCEKEGRVKLMCDSGDHIPAAITTTVTPAEALNLEKQTSPPGGNVMETEEREVDRVARDVLKRLSAL